MLASELDFVLPPRLIAQQPIEPRDHSRLMVLHREQQTIAHRRFDALPELLRPDDLLIFNDTRVLHARLRGRKADSGGRVEALLLRERETNVWEALLKPSAQLRPGMVLEFGSTLTVQATPLERTDIRWLIRFENEANIRELLPLIGELPTPPYIKRQLHNEAEYQTVYARGAGVLSAGQILDSAAAPTAGLHFTPRVLGALSTRGIRTAFVTLGVGVGTFRPVQTEILEEHQMHREEFYVPPVTAQMVGEQRERGGRVVAVGTTTTRVLESLADEHGHITSGFGDTEIFIRPGYQFRCVDALLTNFHLPRSTLLAMIGALAGLDFIHRAYAEAVREEYRFFSFGDAMLIDGERS